MEVQHVTETRFNCLLALLSAGPDGPNLLQHPLCTVID